MVSYEEAIQLILKNTPNQLGVKSLSLFNSLGYALAYNVYSKEDIPPFKISLIDGYAVKSEDLVQCNEDNPKELKLISVEKFEDYFKLKIKEGEAIKVYRGYYIPQGVNAIVEKEYVKEKGNKIIVYKSVKFGENIAEKGYEIKKNQIIAKSGEILVPSLIGLIAKSGHAKIKVFRKPKIYLVITGDEIVSPGRKLSEGKVWDSISYLIFSALRMDGFINIDWHRTGNNITKFMKVIKEALQYSDFIIISGGMFLEESDYLVNILENMGINRIFWGINVKSVKSLYFGTYENKPVFILTGKPASDLICYYEFIRPALLKSSGIKEIFLKEIEAKLTENLKGQYGVTDYFLW